MKTRAIAGLLFFMSTTALAEHVVRIDFKNLSTVSPLSDALSVCKHRYEKGYHSRVHTQGKRKTSHGFIIEIVKSDITQHDGLYLMHNEYKIETKNETFTSRVIATSLGENLTYSGVFTDGKCKGNITLTRN